jgi:dUTP pyrophosphatase
MIVEVRILDRRVESWGFPHYGSALAAGLDLYACLDARLELPPQGKAALIPSGIALRIADPEWCAMVYPRSGMGHRHGLVLGNGVGVIDADYEGPVMVSAWNRDAAETLAIEPGERIAQLVFTRIARPELRVVPEFSAASARGSGGFGSTGR